MATTLSSAELKVLIDAWIENYIHQTVAFAAPQAPTAERLNELFNLLITQGDSAAEAIAHIRDFLTAYMTDVDTKIATDITTAFNVWTAAKAQELNVQFATLTDSLTDVVTVSIQQANTARDAANTATAATLLAKTGTETATTNANVATSAATLAKTNADNAAAAALASKQAADTAATDATQAATDIQEAVENLEETYAPRLTTAESQLAAIVSLQKQQIERRGIQDGIVSISKSRVGYEDTANTVFTEDWSDLSVWASNGGVQVSGGKLYSTGTGGGNHGINHAISLGSNENLRVVAKVSVPSFGADYGGIIIGVSKDAPGAVPPTGSVNTFGVYIHNMNEYIQNFDLGLTTSGPENIKTQVGDYIVTITIDELYISVSTVKTDGTQEACIKRLRAEFNVNNLHIFNDDARGTDGMYVKEYSMRKSLQTIYPRTSGEGIAKTIQWTGNETQGYRVYLPKNYDSRVPSPVAICFHGATTNEYAWSTNTNYKQIQQALVNAGYIVLTFGDVNTTTFGASVSTLGYAKAYKYLKDHYAIGSVVMFCDSMGGIESLNTLSENNIPCAAWVGTAPTYNLRNCYENVIFAGAIKTAYGIVSDGSDYDVKTLGRDPALMSPLVFRCVPMLIISANDDDVINPTQNSIKLLNDVSNTALEITRTVVPNGMGGHSFDNAPYLTQIVDFFNKYIS